MSKKKRRKRDNWSRYFLDIAKLVSTRATCDRLHVGCVFVKDNKIISTGYNGSPSGTPHCDDVGHLMENNRCVRTVHAEDNAIAQAAKFGVSTDGAICYITHTPCPKCSKNLYSAGIRKVICIEKYGNDEVAVNLFKLADGLIYYK